MSHEATTPTCTIWTPSSVYTGQGTSHTTCLAHACILCLCGSVVTFVVIMDPCVWADPEGRGEGMDGPGTKTPLKIWVVQEFMLSEESYCGQKWWWGIQFMWSLYLMSTWICQPPPPPLPPSHHHHRSNPRSAINCLACLSMFTASIILHDEKSYITNILCMEGGGGGTDCTRKPKHGEAS